MSIYFYFYYFYNSTIYRYLCGHILFWGKKNICQKKQFIETKNYNKYEEMFIVQSILVNSKFHCLIRKSLNDLYVVSTLKIGFKITNWYTNLKKKNAHFKKFNLRTFRWDKKYIDIQKKWNYMNLVHKHNFLSSFREL